MSPGIII